MNPNQLIKLFGYPVESNPELIWNNANPVVIKGILIAEWKNTQIQIHHLIYLRCVERPFHY